MNYLLVNNVLGLISLVKSRSSSLFKCIIVPLRVGIWGFRSLDCGMEMICGVIDEKMGDYG